MLKPVPTTADIETALVNLTGISNLTMRQIEHNLSRDHSTLTGSKDLYRLANEDVRGILHGIYEVDSQAKALRAMFEQFLSGRAADRETEKDNLGTDWAAAIAQRAQALEYRQQEVVYQLVDMLEDIVIRAIPFKDEPNAAVRSVMNEICQALGYIRSAIGTAAEQADTPAGEQAQQERASLLLRYWAHDPSTNAQDIVNLVAPFLEAPATTITAEAA